MKAIFTGVEGCCRCRSVQVILHWDDGWTNVCQDCGQVQDFDPITHKLTPTRFNQIRR